MTFIKFPKPTRIRFFRLRKNSTWTETISRLVSALSMPCAKETARQSFALAREFITTRRFWRRINALCKTTVIRDFSMSVLRRHLLTRPLFRTLFPALCRRVRRWHDKILTRLRPILKRCMRFTPIFKSNKRLPKISLSPSVSFIPPVIIFQFIAKSTVCRQAQHWRTADRFSGQSIL